MEGTRWGLTEAHVPVGHVRELLGEGRSDERVVRDEERVALDLCDEMVKDSLRNRTKDCGQDQA